MLFDSSLLFCVHRNVVARSKDNRVFLVAAHQRAILVQSCVDVASYPASLRVGNPESG